MTPSILTAPAARLPQGARMAMLATLAPGSDFRTHARVPHVRRPQVQAGDTSAARAPDGQLS